LNYDRSPGWIIQNRNSNEVPTFGYKAGARYKHFIRKQFAYEIGLSFSQSGFQTNAENLVWVEDNPDYPAKVKTVFNYYHIEIPLKLNYFFHRRRFDVFVSAGLATNFFAAKKSKVKLTFANGEHESNVSFDRVGYSKVSVSAVAGFGIQYSLSSRISAVIEPTYSQFLTSVIIDGYAREYPYSIGITIGMNYSLH
jgi:opacity protein-like surface antigen